MKTPNPTRNQTTTPDPTTPEAHVQALERSELGSDIAPPARRAEDAIAELRGDALVRIYDEHAFSSDAADWLALSFHRDHAPTGFGFGATMAAVHRSALAAHPGLAGLIRSVQIRLAAALHVSPSERDAALSAFDRAIATSLVEAKHELAGPAQALLDADRLAERVAAVRAAHAEHAAQVERERVAAELEAKQAGIRELKVAVSKIEAEPYTDATAANREYRLMHARGALLSARIHASGIRDLRIARAVYDAGSIATSAAAGQLGLAQLALYESALNEAGL